MTTKAILNKRHAEACNINILLDKMCYKMSQKGMAL